MTELQFPLSPERAARLLLAWMRANGGVGSGIKGHTTDRALYHGTINVSLQSIRARGLQAKHSGKFYRELSKTGNIYVTTDKELAAKYAVEAASRYNMNGRYGTRDVTPVVLEVHVPNSATGKLSVDEKEDVSRQGTGIKFKGDIPPAWIKGVARVSVPAETYDSPPQIPVVGQFKTFEDEGDVVYVPWAVELDEPRGLGGPGSGIKGHTTQHKSAIGYVGARGAVHTKVVGDPDNEEHDELWRDKLTPAASRFRYYAPRTGHGAQTPGTIAWNDQPSADDYFAVQDHLERQGLPVERHISGVIGGAIAEPKPRGLGGVGSGIKGHTTNRNPFASSKVPNVVYHASHGAKEFSSMADRPVYFADSPRTTEFGKHEAKAFIDIKNPYLPGGMDDDEVLGRLSERDAENVLGEGQRPDAGTTWHEALRESLVRGTEAPWQEKPFLDAVKASGFDGVISADTHGGKREYVVFSPREQIKTLGGIGSGIRGHVTLHNADARLTKAVEWLNEKRPELMAHVQHVALRPTSPIRLGNYEHATRTINVFRHGHGTGAYIKTIAHEATHAAQKARGERFIKGQMSAQEAEARHAGNDARNEYHGIKGLGGVGSGIKGHTTVRGVAPQTGGAAVKAYRDQHQRNRQKEYEAIAAFRASPEAAEQQRLADAQTNPLAHPGIVLGLSQQGADAERYVAAYGQEFKAAPLPAGVRMGTQRECYKNASLLVMEHPELTYAEGFAKHGETGDVTFMHAWAVTKDGTVVDPTFTHPEKAQYFGVKYERMAYLKYLYSAKIYGVLGSTDANMMRAISTGGKKLRALGGPGSGIRGHHTDREDMPRRACVTKVGRFNYATLGDRLFLINPRTGDVVFGAAGQENATSTGLEGESYVTHAETFADAKQERDIPGSYDDYAKGQVTPPDKLADRIGSIAIRDGGTGDVTGMSMDKFNAARFHGYAAVVDAFRQAGAGPETRVYGFDQLGGDYTHRMTLGELKVRGLGGVGSGIKGHTTVHQPIQSSIGQVAHDGSVESLDFTKGDIVGGLSGVPLSQADMREHSSSFARMAPPSQRFRYHGPSGKNRVVWLDEPTADDYFAVQNHYARLGAAVGDQVVASGRGVIDPRKLKTAGGVGSGIKGHVTLRESTHDAVVNYTADSAPINMALRGFDSYGRPAPSRVPAHHQDTVAALDKAIAASPLDIEARDEAFTRIVPADVVAGWKDAEVYLDKGFVSMSEDPAFKQTLQTEMARPSLVDNYVAVTISVPKGTGLLRVNDVLNSQHDFAWQKEVILGRGHSFKVSRDRGEVYMELVK